MDLTLSQILKLIQDSGVPGLLLLIVVSGAQKWWVFGWLYRDLQRDRDEWKRLALHGTKIVEEMTSIGEEAVRVARERG